MVRRAVWAGLSAHRAFETSYRIRTASGERRYVWEQGRGVFGPNGVLVALEGYIADITAERQAEAERAQLTERVRRAEQLEQLGMFAGGITHDFNNLLVGVLGNIELAIADLPEDAPVRAACERVRASAQSAAGLTHQLLAFTGRGRIDVQSVSLSALAHETAVLLGILRFPGVRFEEELTEGLLPVTGDPSQLRQVVMNLLLNARDALGETGGHITLRTGAAPGGAEDERDSARPCVFLEVEDDGCGMDTATQERIFAPFFSTKGGGRGLGLSAVAGVVRGHEGRIELDSTPGKGTRFRVVFPAAARVATQAGETSDEAASVASGDEKLDAPGIVLVADDSPDVRGLMRVVLVRMGFEVVEVEDGQQAVDLVRDRGATIRIVVLDLSMPRKGGAEALSEIRALGFTMPVLLCSGYDMKETAALADEVENVHFLHKPFELSDFRAKVQRAL